MHIAHLRLCKNMLQFKKGGVDVKRVLALVVALCVVCGMVGCNSEPKQPSKTQEPVHTAELTEVELFAKNNGISVELAESLESVLLGMELTDSSRTGVFHYKLSDVYNFEQTDDWAEGERYKMWMDMEHIWYAYCKGDAVVGVRDGNGNVFYTAE